MYYNISQQCLRQIIQEIEKMMLTFKSVLKSKPKFTHNIFFKAEEEITRM